MSTIDLKALIRKKIKEPGYEKLHETLRETLHETPEQESHEESHEILHPSDRIRQTFYLETTHPVKWPEDLFKGVPEDAVMRFPSIRHEPDLRGFGMPSDKLPDELQIFGYWGYKLRLVRYTRTLQLVTTPRSATCHHHVSNWLHWRYDEVLEAFIQWQVKVKMSNFAMV